MPDDDLPPLEACREKALKLLEGRPHSVDELRRKLLNRRIFAPELIETVIADFLQVGLLDDADFAHTACDALKASSPIGRRRAQQKLIRHGLAPELVRQTLDDHWDTSDDPETERALRAAHQKWRSLLRQTSRPLPLKRQSLARFLAARGFASDTIAALLAKPDFKTDQAPDQRP